MNLCILSVLSWIKKCLILCKGSNAQMNHSQFLNISWDDNVTWLNYYYVFLPRLFSIWRFSLHPKAGGWIGGHRLCRRGQWTPATASAPETKICSFREYAEHLWKWRSRESRSRDWGKNQYLWTAEFTHSYSDSISFTSHRHGAICLRFLRRSIISTLGQHNSLSAGKSGRLVNALIPEA